MAHYADAGTIWHYTRAPCEHHLSTLSGTLPKIELRMRICAPVNELYWIASNTIPSQYLHRETVKAGMRNGMEYRMEYGMEHGMKYGMGKR